MKRQPSSEYKRRSVRDIHDAVVLKQQGEQKDGTDIDQDHAAENSDDGGQIEHVSNIVADGTIIDVMPREADSAPKGVTRRRTTRAASPTTTRKTSGPRARAPVRVARKAPTPIRATANTNRKLIRLNLVVVVFCIAAIGGSVAYGMSDKGALDPSTIITERNDRIAQGEVVPTDAASGKRTVAVPVQGGVRRTGGTPRGMGDIALPTSPRPAASAATETASSSADGVSEATATSTDEEIEVDDSDTTATSSTES